MKTINILCADGLEECEALLIHDILTRAKFEVKLVNTMEKNEILTSHNLIFKTDLKLSEIDNQADALFLPGGLKGSQNLRENEAVKKLILNYHKTGKIVAAVCAAPDILAELGLVKDLEFTCYPGCDYHQKATNQKVVVKDHIITAQALGSCFELAFELIKALSDAQHAKDILKQIYYQI